VLHALLIVAGGLAIGASLGLLGGGGTILTVPLLLLLGMEAKTAIAMSLPVVAATAAVAALGHARQGNVEWRAAAIFAPATALGGFAGGRAAAWVAGEVLLLVFTGLMVAAAGLMLRPPRRAVPSAGRPRGTGPAGVALLGTATGAVTGLVGAGGGFLFVPVFALLAGMPMASAVGTSLVVIAVNSIAAFSGHLRHATLDPGLVAGITGATAVGAWVGARLAQRTSEARLRRAFGLFLLLVAGWMLARNPGVRGLFGL
jgi:uncharacterized membrane protein YfcA